MSQTITRTYDSAAKAQAVCWALKKSGFPSARVSLLPHDDEAPLIQWASVVSEDEIVVFVEETDGDDGFAPVDLEPVSQPRASVSVNALFGSGQRATSILDSFDPMSVEFVDGQLNIAAGGSIHSPSDGKDASPSNVSAAPSLSQDPAPCSRLLGAPLLLDNPTPLSTFLHVSPLMDSGKSLSGSLGIAMLLGERGAS